MDVDEEIGVETDCDENDGEAPVVAKGVAKDGWVWAEPTPVATDGSIGVHVKSRTTYLKVSITEIICI